MVIDQDEYLPENGYRYVISGENSNLDPDLPPAQTPADPSGQSGISGQGTSSSGRRVVLVLVTILLRLFLQSMCLRWCLFGLCLWCWNMQIFSCQRFYIEPNYTSKVKLTIYCLQGRRLGLGFGGNHFASVSRNFLSRISKLPFFQPKFLMTF